MVKTASEVITAITSLVCLKPLHLESFTSGSIEKGDHGPGVAKRQRQFRK
jgi:hypothetical protein